MWTEETAHFRRNHRMHTWYDSLIEAGANILIVMNGPYDDQELRAVPVAEGKSLKYLVPMVLINNEQGKLLRDYLEKKTKVVISVDYDAVSRSTEE